MPGRKPETFQIGQKIAQSGAMNKPTEVDQGEKCAAAKEMGNRAKTFGCPKRPFMHCSSRSGGLKSSAD